MSGMRRADESIFYIFEERVYGLMQTNFSNGQSASVSSGLHKPLCDGVVGVLDPRDFLVSSAFRTCKGTPLLRGSEYEKKFCFLCLSDGMILFMVSRCKIWLKGHNLILCCFC